MTADLLTLKLHVDDDDIVWLLFADNPPKNTRQTLIPFMMSDISRYQHIRLIGNQQNAQLILGLYQRQMQLGEGCIELCSPLVCRTEEVRHRPIQALLAMRQFERSASTGGWHILRRNDATTYAIISYMQKICQIDNNLTKLLQTHVVWPALSFIPRINPILCSFLLAEIVDPRWYIDLRHPARGSRLRKYLGLDLKTMRGVLDLGPRQRLHARCRLVLDTWRVDTDPWLMEKPDHFLYRIARHVGEKKSTELGLLRASQVFIEFLRLAWLAGLSAGRKQAEALFVPEYFFKEKYETTAFREHMQKVLQ